MNCSKFLLVGERKKKRLPLLDESRDAHNFPRSPRPASMSAEAGEGGIFTRTRKRARSETAREEATFAGLPRDVKNQILGRTDLLDLARLRVVSPSMRDAVDEMMEDRKRCCSCAKLGRLTVLKNLLQWGHLNKVVVCMGAAQYGHLEILKWARQNGCPWDTRTCEFAARGGHLEVLKWLTENGCPWDDLTCAGAAERGHLEVLKWARANGCRLDEMMCAFAAQHGHLETLKWARETAARGTIGRVRTRRGTAISRC
jgi:hypothetical protein